MKKLFLIIGAPGSGKTTDASIIAEKNSDSIVHYSTGDMLREEVEDMGPVRIKEVEDAQQAITRIIQDMEEKGELIISGRRGEEFIS